MRGRVQSLLLQIEAILREAGYRAAGAVENAQRASAGAGAEDAAQAARAGLITKWNRLPASQLEALVGYMADGTPLHDRLVREGAEAAGRAKEALFHSILEGRGAAAIGRELANAVATVSRANAVLIARTESLRAYRTATIASYAYNSEEVSGWRWLAPKDPRTCAACLALDGTVHPLTESFGSHPACRCTAVPEITGRTVEYGPTGKEWFNGQPRVVQRRILGPAKFQLYQAGKIGLDDLVHRVPSVWGPTANVKSIRQLVGEGVITAEDVSAARLAASRTPIRERKALIP